MEVKKIRLNEHEALKKMQSFCAYQERSQEEVRTKLHDYGVFGLVAEQIIVELLSENFINEERFTCAYVSGKFRIKNWGKLKIKAGLRAHKIPDKLIERALNKEIEDEAYKNTINILIKKLNLPKAKTNPRVKNELLKKLYAKGYAMEDVLPLISA